MTNVNSGNGGKRGGSSRFIFGRGERDAQLSGVGPAREDKVDGEVSGEVYDSAADGSFDEAFEEYYDEPARSAEVGQIDTGQSTEPATFFGPENADRVAEPERRGRHRRIDDDDDDFEYAAAAPAARASDIEDADFEDVEGYEDYNDYDRDGYADEDADYPDARYDYEKYEPAAYGEDRAEHSDDYAEYDSEYDGEFDAEYGYEDDDEDRDDRAAAGAAGAGAVGAGSSAAAAGGIPKRGLAMILIAVAVLLGLWGIYAMVQGGKGDADKQAEQAQNQPAEQPQNPGAAPQGAENANPGGEDAANRDPNSPEAAPQAGAGQPMTAANETINVYNNSTVPNLAAEVSDQLRGQGTRVGEVGNIGESTAVLQQNTVFYDPATPGAEERARVLADRVGGIAKPNDGTVPAPAANPGSLTLVLTGPVNL